MKKIAVLSALIAVLMTGNAFAADSKIGILDMRKVLEQSDAGKSLTTQLKSRQAAVQKEATELEKKLKDEETKILSERDKLKKEEFEAKKISFEQDFMKSRQIVLTKTVDLDEARKKALAEMQKHVAKAAADVASDKKLDMVVDRQFVVLAQDDMDITDAVMSKVNAAVKTMTLSAGK